MSKVFISHSSNDVELVKSFEHLLRLGMNFKKEDIFCTSIKGSLPSGKGFIDVIKENIYECEAVVFLLTESYLKSQFCMAELGAAWALKQKIFPLLVPPITHKDISGTPLLGLQCLNLFDRKDVEQLGTEFLSLKISSFSLSDFNIEMDTFFLTNKVSNLFQISQEKKIVSTEKCQKHVDMLIEQTQQNDKARFLLGMIYWEGVLVPQDSIKAKELLSEAAVNGYAPAIYYLSSLYYKGDSGEQSFKKAHDWATKLNPKKDSCMMGKLGFLYQTGLGCERNLDKASECYKLATSSGDQSWYSTLGEIYSIKGEYSEAVRYYKKSVESGYKYAALTLGLLYKEGRKGLEANFREAMYYLGIAADAGITEAKYQLGQLYYLGYGVYERDFKAAFYWFKEAAKEGNLRSQYNLGYAYQHGLGVERNLDLAIYWHEKAADRGHQLSQINLADMYASFSKKEYEKAVYWYKKAAEQNSAEAHRKLGDIYAFGLLGEVDQISALNHYRLAAEQHEQVAQLRLECGNGVKSETI